jgi:hypothetical protein
MRISTFTVLVAVLALFGCSSGSGNDAGAGTDGGSGSDAGNPTDSGSTTDSGCLTSSTNSGNISFVKSPLFTDVNAELAARSSTVIVDHCASAGCVFIPALDAGTDAGTVDGGLIAGGTLTAMDLTSNKQSALGQTSTAAGPIYSTIGLPWAGGDSLQLVATGGAFPGFTADITAPADLAGVTPSLATAVPISQSHDLVLSWTPSNAQAMAFTILNSAGVIVCGGVSDSAGTLTVSSSLLSQLSTTSSAKALDLTRGNATTAAAGGQSVIVSATYSLTGSYTLSP